MNFSKFYKTINLVDEPKEVLIYLYIYSGKTDA